jgi:phage host-nuclease inhibitor protein Gam
VKVVDSLLNLLETHMAKEYPTQLLIVDQMLERIGAHERHLNKVRASMNADVARVGTKYAPLILEIQGRIETLRRDLKKFATAHRSKLMGDPLVKTLATVSGKIGWRRLPDEVVRSSRQVSDEEMIRLLEEGGLGKFVRVEKSIDWRAVGAASAADKDLLAKKLSLRFRRGYEEFYARAEVLGSEQPKR